MRALALAALLLGGCTLFDDPPDRSCRSTALDCFQAQGEVCNQDTHQCELELDAGTPLEETEGDELESTSEEMIDE